MFYFVRIGDGDRYHQLDSIEEVAKKFQENGITSVERYCRYGFQSENFQGNDYISLYNAFNIDGLGLCEISDEDFSKLNNLLDGRK